MSLSLFNQFALPLTIFFGATVGIGLFAVVLGLQKRAPRDKRSQIRLSKLRAKGTQTEATKVLAEHMLQVLLAVALAFLAVVGTGWPAAGVMGGLAGWFGPLMARAPARREKAIDEIEAYSQWTEQIRDLVRASGSLFEAVSLSASNAPISLRPQVLKMASIARIVGLPPALDWFASEMRSPYADRLVLGMKIAWDSGARVSEAFHSTARGMRNEVEMRRRNEVANSRAWTQVVSIMAVTFICVAFMFVFNRGFFDPFGSGVGQLVLLMVCALIFGNVHWVLQLSSSSAPIRLLVLDRSSVERFDKTAADTEAERETETV